MKLIAPPGLKANDGFGTAVDMDGNYLIVGAPLRDHFPSTADGAACVDHDTGGTWVQDGGKLVPTDGYLAQLCGCSVATRGEFTGGHASKLCPLGLFWT